MNDKKYWIVFVVDATGEETKVDFVLETTIPEERLIEILTAENKKRKLFGRQPLRYEEFQIHPKTQILSEAQRQYARDESVCKNEEFKDFLNAIVVAEIEERSKCGSEKPDSEK